MNEEQAKKLYEITEKELNHSLNMMEKLLEINSNNETLKLAKTYLSDHIDKCKQILVDVERMDYITIREKEVVLPHELQDDNNSDNVVDW